MTEEDSIIDDVSRHRPGDVGFERSALPPGLFLAWCVSLDQVSREFLDSAGTTITRLKMRDVSPTDAFVSTCGGELRAETLSAAARRFAGEHYERYLEQLRTLLPQDGSDTVDGWAVYDQISPWLTRCWFNQRDNAGADAGGVVSRVARWWSSR